MKKAKTISAPVGGEVAHLLDEAERGPLLIERGGKLFRLAVESNEPLWGEYDPGEVHRVLDEMAGSLEPEEADRMLADLNRRRGEACEPTSQP